MKRQTNPSKPNHKLTLPEQRIRELSHTEIELGSGSIAQLVFEISLSSINC